MHTKGETGTDEPAELPRSVDLMNIVSHTALTGNQILITILRLSVSQPKMSLGVSLNTLKILTLTSTLAATFYGQISPLAYMQSIQKYNLLYPIFNS